MLRQRSQCKTAKWLDFQKNLKTSEATMSKYESCQWKEFHPSEDVAKKYFITHLTYEVLNVLLKWLPILKLQISLDI